MLTAFSLAVGGEFRELINAFFQIKTKHETLMSNSELENFVGE